MAQDRLSRRGGPCSRQRGTAGDGRSAGAGRAQQSWGSRLTQGRAGSPEWHGGSATPGVAKTSSVLTEGPEQGVTPKVTWGSGKWGRWGARGRLARGGTRKPILDLGENGGAGGWCVYGWVHRSPQTLTPLFGHRLYPTTKEKVKKSKAAGDPQRDCGRRQSRWLRASSTGAEESRCETFA